MKPVRILFVCMGNICRSPAAESVLRRMIHSRGLEGRIEVDSAGTLNYHAGSRPDSRSLTALTARGYSTDHKARQVTGQDSHTFDHLIVMDDTNLRDLRDILGSQAGGAQISRLMDWWPAGGRTDVPDPYYGNKQDFEFMMDLIEGACAALLDHLEMEQRPGA
jgi:protein-tyrosine phosphatase